jgi:hypothetical protein
MDLQAAASLSCSLPKVLDPTKEVARIFLTAEKQRMDDTFRLKVPHTSYAHPHYAHMADLERCSFVLFVFFKTGSFEVRRDDT